MTPASYNIIIPQRADFSLDIQLKDSTGTPLNMTGYSVEAEIWTERRTNRLANMVVTFTDRPTGKLNLSIPNSVTTTITSVGVWDLLVINPSGKRDYWIRGRTALAVGYTDVG
jgi:hypothetical protein